MKDLFSNNATLAQFMPHELKLRILSALVLSVLTLAITWQGGYSFAAFAAIMGLLMFYEWHKITESLGTAPLVKMIGWLSLLISFTFLFFNQDNFAVASLIFGAFAALVAGKLKREAFWSAVGTLYCGLPAIALVELRGEGLFGLFAIIFIFAVVWASDILAYFCGRALSGPKLAPAISPGKTWSGAIFGLAAGIGAGVAVVLTLRDGGGLWIPLTAASLSIASQVGDLLESWVKRRFGVKDSSQLIPGHGGVLDRVDGLVMAAIVAYLIALSGQTSSSAVEPDLMLAVRLLGL